MARKALKSGGAKSKARLKINKDKVKILIVDDHPIVRQGLDRLINRQDDLTVCGQAEGSLEALKAIKNAMPDIVVVDISLKDRSGLELIKDLKARYPDLAVLALSMYDESMYAERSLRAGARGYVMKAEATENVVRAIRQILAGRIYLSEKMVAKMVCKLAGHKIDTASSPVDRLSDRELEVFMMLGQGIGTRQIAEKLCLSVKTIETYRAHIKEKLDLVDASALLSYAIQWVNCQDKS
ncbi:MAG: response regulator transcription factor [Planctomycetota bacterium]|jgi:DNA-binding NarL/FixJ family response regulator